MRRRVVVGLAVALALGARSGGDARAQERVVVGLYAPAAPFNGPRERLEYISSLAAHLSASIEGTQVTGRVFARSAEFAAAVKQGAIQFGVVDAPYAAAVGLPYKILGSTTREGSATSQWMLVASDAVSGLGDLGGKHVAMPRIGAQDKAFLTNVLLEGEVDAGFFGKITLSPDAFSAATMVKLGSAQAAFVPSGVPLPAGVHAVITLRAVGWPMFVALPGASRALTDTFAAALVGFGSGALTGMGGPEAGRYGELRGSFGKARRVGPMAVPRPSRLAVKAFVGDPERAIPLSDLGGLLVKPAPASTGSSAPP